MFGFDPIHFKWQAVVIRMKNLAIIPSKPCWIYQTYGVNAAKFYFIADKNRYIQTAGLFFNRNKMAATLGCPAPRWRHQW